MSITVSFNNLPNIDPNKLQPIDIEALVGPETSRLPPRVLVLYGSLRERSFSRRVNQSTH